MTHLDGITRKSCPLCGGRIEVSDLFQYCRTYTINKGGKLSKKYKVEDNGGIGVSSARCSCGANWDAGEFEIDKNGYFVDYKY